MRKLLKHWFFTRVIKNYPKQFMSGGTNVVQDTSYLTSASCLSLTCLHPGETPMFKVSQLMIVILYSVLTVIKLFMIVIT